MPASPSSRPGRRPDPALHTLWQQRLLRFKRSDLSVSAFCNREGISTPSFYAWRRRLRLDPPTAPDGPRFLPIRVLPAAAPVELVLPCGAALRLTAGCDLAFVRSLVDSLGGASC
jgi:transposase